MLTHVNFGPSLYGPILYFVGKIGPMKQEHPHAPGIVNMTDLLQIAAENQNMNIQHPQDLIITQLVFNKSQLSSGIMSLFEKSKKSSSSTTKSNNKKNLPNRSVKLSFTVIQEQELFSQKNINTSINTSINTKSMSGGSDNLAPFVSTVLRERTVDEMENEIDELRSKLIEFEDERLLVQITGKNSTPIHYKESINRAEHPLYGEHMYDLCLNFYVDDDYECKTDPNTLPLNATEEMEIRLGGVVIQRFDMDDLIVHFKQDYHYDRENQTKSISLTSNNTNPRLYGPIKSICGKIGP
jgi:hypothetical protein